MIFIKIAISELLLKSGDHTVKLSYEEWLKIERIKLAATAEVKNQEPQTKELEKYQSMRGKEELWTVDKYLETDYVGITYSSVDSLNRAEVSSEDDLKESEKAERGRCRQVFLQ